MPQENVTIFPQPQQSVAGASRTSAPGQGGPRRWPLSLEPAHLNREILQQPPTLAKQQASATTGATSGPEDWPRFTQEDEDLTMEEKAAGAGGA